jgi:hypothetical protein
MPWSTAYRRALARVSKRGTKRSTRWCVALPWPLRIATDAAKLPPSVRVTSGETRYLPTEMVCSGFVIIENGLAHAEGGTAHKWVLGSRRGLPSARGSTRPQRESGHATQGVKAGEKLAVWVLLTAAGPVGPAGLSVAPGKCDAAGRVSRQLPR